MHKTRLRQVKAAILASAKVGKFDMCIPGPAEGLTPSECGTRGCIAGHAVWLFATTRQAKQLYDQLYWDGSGAYLLDLPGAVAYNLFHGRNFGGTWISAETAAASIDALLSKPAVGHYDGPIPEGKALRALYRRGRA